MPTNGGAYKTTEHMSLTTSDRISELSRHLSRFHLPEKVREDIRTEIEALESSLEQESAARLDAKNTEAAQVRGVASLPALTPEEQSRASALLVPTGPLMHAVTMDCINRFEKEDNCADKDVERRNKKTVKQLKERGQFRNLRELPKDWNRRLDKLCSRLPNFREPIEYLRASFFAAGRRDGAIQFDAMLLDGPPGIGKTLFAEELSKAFTLPMIRADMASAQSSSFLAGSDIFWINTKPGRVFGEVMLGEVGNPLFLLDELEKAAGDERYPSTGALYSLLERRTAREFEDQSYPGIRFDASGILWIGTSNDYSRIERPILDRMRIFNLKAPSPAQMRAIVMASIDEVLAELRLTRKQVSVSRSAIDALATMSPRAMRRVITESIAHTALSRKRKLQLCERSSRRAPVGFA